MVRFFEHHFRQLGENEEHPQINRKQTSDFFSDEDLRNLCLINNAYVDWKEKESKYDELDIVRIALQSHAGTQHKESSIQVLTAEQREKMLGLINQGVDQSVQFSNRCKRAFRSQFRDPEFKTKLHSWLTTVKANGIPSRVSSIGHTEYGHTVYRDRMGNPWRVFFSVLKKSGINRNKPFLYIHHICHTDDQQQAEEICGSDGADLEAEEVSIESWGSRVEELLDYGNLGDNSLPAPLPDDLSREESLDALLTNESIILDRTQQDALASDRPLLIDGLAGTGKTSVLSVRAGLLLNHSPNPARILVCASGAHVVETLFKGVQRATSKALKEGKMRVNWQFSGFESNSGSHHPISQIGTMYPNLGFDEIVLDECQDLTHLEFELLTRLVKGRDARRFSIAGDPMQTLNPTGFDWGRIKALFINKNVEKGLVSTSPFHTNYRSQRHIVNLANGIQHVREKVTNVESVIMTPSLPAGQNRPYLVSIGGAESEELVGVLGDAGKGRNNAVLITWASDDQAIKSLLEGDDEVLTKIWNDFLPDDYVDADGFRSVFAIHSTTSIKGSETDSVILYKFLSTEGSRQKLASMLTPYDELSGAPSSDKVSIAYAFSKLYVAVTRAHQNVFIFEDKEGFEFWQNVKLILKDHNGEILQPDFFSRSLNLVEVVMANPDVFNATIEKSRTNFEKHYFRWKETKNFNDLLIAINIGTDLLKREGRENNQDIYFKLEELKGNLEERKAAEASDDTSRNEHFDKALDHYTNARLTERIAPIRFMQENWAECVNQLVADTPFHAMILNYCKLKLGLEVDAPNLFSFNAPERAPQHWDVSVSDIMVELKRMAFSLFFDDEGFSKPNDLIFDNSHWFGVSLILEELALRNQPSLLLTRIWDTQGYHEETARLAARSFLELSPDVTESAISSLRGIIRRYPSLESELLPNLIRKRKLWLQMTDGISNGVESIDSKIFVDYARNEIQLRNGATDVQIRESVRLKIKTLYQAVCLNNELDRAGLPPHDFPRRVKDILELLYKRREDATQPPLDDLIGRNAEYEFHTKLEGAYHLFFELASILKSPDVNAAGRFGWLNNNEYINAIAKRLDDNFESNRKLPREGRSLDDTAGFYYAGSLYFHIKSENGRKFPSYLSNLSALSLSKTRVALQYHSVLKAMIPYLISKNLENKESLAEQEIHFILNSVRALGHLRDFRRISTPKLEELGCSPRQVQEYEFELFKRKHPWAWDIDDNRPLSKKPITTQEEKYFAHLKTLELDELKEQYYQLIPVDWGSKFSLMCSNITTYQEFWGLLIEYMNATGEQFVSLVNGKAFDQWISEINALTYGEEALPGREDERLQAFQPIASQSQYPGIVASNSEGLLNPLFFLQFTSEFSYLFGYRDSVMNSEGLEFHPIDIGLLREVLRRRLELLRPKPPQGNLSAQQSIDFEMSAQAFSNFESEVMSLFDGRKIYLEALALHLSGETLAGLRKIATEYFPDLEHKTSKPAMLKAVVDALGVRETTTAQKHLL